MTTNNSNYIMYGHTRVAKTKTGEYVYFNNIYSNTFSTSMCGGDRIYELTFKVHANQERDKEEVEYWGWIEDGKVSMIHAKYFLLAMCFPNIKISEERGEGKAVKFNLINFKKL